MTKREYIEQHPKSYLAHALETNDWPDDQPIQIIGGLDAPDNRNSNLYAALTTAKHTGGLGEYEIGGHRQRGTEGWWMAVA